MQSLHLDLAEQKLGQKEQEFDQKEQEIFDFFAY